MPQWLVEVQIKYQKKNQILFSRNSSCLQELLQLIKQQKHRTLVMWAFLCIENTIQTLKKHYHQDKRPLKAFKLCQEWSKGNIKMPVAKKALLAVHAMAKDINNPIDIALCHAVGHACATVHVETHAIGLAIYELTAIVLKYGIDNCQKEVENKISYYHETLKYCQKNINNYQEQWASFLLDDSRPNKEALL